MVASVLVEKETRKDSNTSLMEVLIAHSSLKFTPYGSVCNYFHCHMKFNAQPGNCSLFEYHTPQNSSVVILCVVIQ